MSVNGIPHLLLPHTRNIWTFSLFHVSTNTRYFHLLNLPSSGGCELTSHYGFNLNSPIANKSAHFFSHKFVGHLCLQQDTSMILFLQLNIHFILVILLVVTLFYLLTNLLILNLDIVSGLTFIKLLPYITPSLSSPKNFLSIFPKCTFNLSRKKCP